MHISPWKQLLWADSVGRTMDCSIDIANRSFRSFKPAEGGCFMAGAKWPLMVQLMDRVIKHSGAQPDLIAG